MNELDVCNWALCKLGQRPLERLEDSSSKAQLCRLLFLPLHRGLLRSFAWSFATGYKSLSRDLELSERKGFYHYPLPSGYIQILSIPDGYTLEGNVVLKKKAFFK